MRGRLWPAILVAGFLACWVLPGQSGIYGAASGGLAEFTVSYHTSAEMADLMQEMARSYPGTAEYSTAQGLLSVRSIPGGLVIPILFIGDRGDDRPWVMLIGAHHGDEPDSGEAVLSFAHYLLSSAGNGDQTSIEVVSSLNIAVLPVVNPYGLDRGSRLDENGEDVNRDYPFSPSEPSAASDGVPLTTAGATTVHRLASMYPFTIALSFHTGSVGIYTPWGAPGLGNNTPDGHCFLKTAEALSRASGRDLDHGPANDHGYLGDLDGAFDDHLYASSFMRERLYSEEMGLPYSSFAATVELSGNKEPNMARLGDLQGIMAPGSEHDGTVPLAIRICLAACEIASPSMTGSVDARNGVVSLHLKGAVSVDGIEGNMGAPISQVERHPFLPEYDFLSQVTLPKGGSVEVWASASVDADWSARKEGGYPDSGPFSLLALSRGVQGYRTPILWSTVIEIEGQEQRPEAVMSIEGLSSYQVQAGSAVLASLKLDLSSEVPQGLLVTSRVGDDAVLTELEGEDLVDGAFEIEVPTPETAGLVDLGFLLRTDKGEKTANTTLWTYPYVYLMGHGNLVGREGFHRFAVGVDGGTGPTTVIWGLSQEEDLPWDSEGWAVGPSMIISSGFGPEYIDVDLSHFGGELHFRACNFPGAVESTGAIVLERGLVAPKPQVKVEGDWARIGPALVLYTDMGLIQADPARDDVEYLVELVSSKGDTVLSLPMEWVFLQNMDAANRSMVREAASSAGAPPDGIKGAFFLDLDIPADGGNYKLKIRVHCIIRGEDGSVLFEGTSRDEEMLPLSLPEEEKDEGPFPWPIIFFIIIATLLLLGFTVMRYRVREREQEQSSEGRNARFKDRTEHFMGTGRQNRSRPVVGNAGRKAGPIRPM